MTDHNDWNTALEQMKAVEARLKAAAETPPKKKRRRGVLLLGGVILIIMIAIVGVLLVSNVYNTTPPPQVIEADPAQFDPQISLETVQRFAGDNLRFLSLTMTQVNPDGTVDFQAGVSPKVEYTFTNADGTGITVVSVANDLTMSRSTRAVAPDETIPDRVEPPACDIPQLWQLAKTYDAPEYGIANVHYDVAGYNFVISSVDIDLQFNRECILIRD